MHDTILQNGTVQSMVFRHGNREWNSEVPIRDELLGKPKGMKRILQERGLWQGPKKQSVAPRAGWSSVFCSEVQEARIMHNL